MGLTVLIFAVLEMSFDVLDTKFKPLSFYINICSFSEMIVKLYSCL